MSNIIKNGFTTTMDDCVNAATVAEALTAQNKYIEEHAVQGPQGKPGKDGPANVLSIGSVTKGENAEVTVTGEAPAQVLNFVLPQGDRGPQGEPGKDGEDMLFYSSVVLTSQPGIGTEVFLTYDRLTASPFNRSPKTGNYAVICWRLNNESGLAFGYIQRITISDNYNEAVLKIKVSLSTTGEPGPQGEPGKDGISFNYKGSWTENNDYNVNDVVKSDGDLYICILAISGSITKPTQDATHWSLFLSGGGVTLKWKTVVPQGAAYFLDVEKAVAFKSEIPFTFTYNEKTYNCTLGQLNMLGKYKSLDAILGGEGIVFASSGSEIIPVFVNVGLKLAVGSGVKQYYIKLFKVIANTFGTFADVTATCNIPILPGETNIDVLTYE